MSAITPDQYRKLREPTKEITLPSGAIFEISPMSMMEFEEMTSEITKDDQDIREKIIAGKRANQPQPEKLTDSVENKIGTQMINTLFSKDNQNKRNSFLLKHTKTPALTLDNNEKDKLYINEINEVDRDMIMLQIFIYSGEIWKDISKKNET